jgi:hypothetical protein
MPRERMGAAPALELPSKEEQLELELQSIQRARLPEDLLKRRELYQYEAKMGRSNLKEFEEKNRAASLIANTKWIVHRNDAKYEEADRRLNEFSVDDFLDARARVLDQMKALEDQKEKDPDADQSVLEEQIRVARTSLGRVDRVLEDRGLTQRDIRTKQAEHQKAKEESQLPDLTDDVFEMDATQDDSGVHEKRPISEKRPKRPDASATELSPRARKTLRLVLDDEPANSNAHASAVDGDGEVMDVQDDELEEVPFHPKYPLTPPPQERAPRVEKRPRMPELPPLGAIIPADDIEIPLNDKLVNLSETEPLSDAAFEEEFHVNERLTKAIDADKTVTRWRERLKEVDTTNPENNELVSQLRNRLRKAKLLAEQRAAKAEIKQFDRQLEGTNEEEAQTHDRIRDAQKRIQEERELLREARENPEHKRHLGQLKLKKEEIDEIHERWTSKSEALLKNPNLSPETRAYIENAARKHQVPPKDGVLQDKIAATEERITSVSEEVIPLLESNIARMEEEIAGLQLHLKTLEPRRKHIVHLQEILQKDHIEVPGGLLIEREGKEIDLNVDDLPMIVRDGELEVVPPRKEKEKEKSEAERLEEAKKQADKKAQLEPDPESDPEMLFVTKESIDELYEELKAVPEGKKYQKRRLEIADKIAKAELLLKEKEAREEEASAKAEADQLKKEIIALQAAFDAKSHDAEAAQQKQAELLRKADQNEEQRRMLRARLEKEPDHAESITQQIIALDSELTGLRKEAEENSERIPLLEREAGELADQCDAATARHHLSLDKWAALGAVLGGLSAKLEPLKHVSVQLAPPEKTLAARAKEKAVRAGRATGRFADRHKGKVAAAAGASTAGYWGVKSGFLLTAAKYLAIALSPFAVKKSWKTFNKFEKKMDSEGFFSALKEFWTDDDKKKED